MGVSMAPQDPYFNVMNLVNQLNPNPDPNQMDAVAKMAQNQPTSPTGASGQIIDNLKRNEVQAVIQDLIEFKRMRDTGKLPAGFKPSPEQMQKFHQEVGPHLTTEEFGSIMKMYSETVSPSGPGSEEGSAPQPQQPQQPAPAQNPLLSQMLRPAAGMLQQPMSAEERSAPSPEGQPEPAPSSPSPDIPPMPGWTELLIAALGSMGHPNPNQGEILSNAMHNRVTSHLKGVELANEAEAKKQALLIAEKNAGKERSQLIKVRNPKGELEQIWLQVGQPLPAGYTPYESEGQPKFVYDENKGLWGLADNEGKITSYLPKGVKPQAEKTTEVRVSAFSNVPAPSFMPPGYIFNRPSGKYVWKGNGPEPGGTYEQQSADWQAVKRATLTSNSPTIKRLSAAGTALFEGTKDKSGKTVIEPTLIKLVRLRNEMPDTFFSAWSNQVKLFNTWDQLIAWNVSDPKFAELKSTAIAAAERMGMIYQGGVGATSDVKLKLAMSLLDPSLGKEAFAAVAEGHGRDLMNTVNSYVTVNPIKAGAGAPFQNAFTLPQNTKTPGALTPQQEADKYLQGK